MRVKRSNLAGTWYPGDAPTLRSTVDDLLGAADPGARARWVGAIVPHAGMNYSGAVAAAAYRQLAGSTVRRVVLLAPSHTGSFRGFAVPDADAFETPLGLVPVDSETAGLADGSLVRVDPSPFRGEHSLEIQLPFLQRALPGASIVPLLAGRLLEADDARASALLERLSDRETIFVISSDFTHFGWRFDYVPFLPADAGEARRLLRELDMGAIEPALRCDPVAFRQHLVRTGDTVCGHVPIAAFLAWAQGRLGGTLLDYRTSLDVTGDYEHCVSYAAIGFECVGSS